MTRLDAIRAHHKEHRMDESLAGLQAFFDVEWLLARVEELRIGLTHVLWLTPDSPTNFRQMDQARSALARLEEDE